jgi:hypothetical protein
VGFPKVQRLVSTYREIGVRSAVVLKLHAIELTSRLAQVTVGWTLADGKRRSIYEFEAPYSLTDRGRRHADHGHRIGPGMGGFDSHGLAGVTTPARGGSPRWRIRMQEAPPSRPPPTGRSPGLRRAPPTLVVLAARYAALITTSLGLQESDRSVRWISELDTAMSEAAGSPEASRSRSSLARLSRW